MQRFFSFIVSFSPVANCVIMRFIFFSFLP
nr:MAG TPA: hypothetical protein [Caudoviricetes sp.]